MLIEIPGIPFADHHKSRRIMTKGNGCSSRNVGVALLTVMNSLTLRLPRFTDAVVARVTEGEAEAVGDNDQRFEEEALGKVERDTVSLRVATDKERVGRVLEELMDSVDDTSVECVGVFSAVPVEDAVVVPVCGINSVAVGSIVTDGNVGVLVPVAIEGLIPSEGVTEWVNE